MKQVLSYGGGIQSAAMCVLVARGKLPRPDFVIFADTGYETRSTVQYMGSEINPLLADVGLRVEIANHGLATVDIYAKNGDLLLPAFTGKGKLPTFCSGEWKREVVRRYLRLVRKVKTADLWIGFSLDEKRRASKQPDDGPWHFKYPLLDLMLTRADCEGIIADAGLPVPRKSACFMCPHRTNAEWRLIRDWQPEEWQWAKQIDQEIREADAYGDVYLHKDRVPLAQADIDAPDRERGEQCGLGLCFI